MMMMLSVVFDNVIETLLHGGDDGATALSSMVMAVRLSVDIEWYGGDSATTLSSMVVTVRLSVDIEWYGGGSATKW